MTSARDSIRDALAYVPANDRDTWVRMGMAVKSEIGDDGYDIWTEWSQRDESFNESDAKAVWRSIKPGGKVTVATLFHEAQRHGYRVNGHARCPEPTSAEREQRERHTREAAAREAEEEAAAAKLAGDVFKVALPARADHPYLARKHVPPVVTLRELPAPELARLVGYIVKHKADPLTGRVLLAAIRNRDAISSLEFIDEAGRKSALADGAKSGGYWSAQRMPESDGEGLTLFLCEGVATTLTVHIAADAPAFAALSCHNLPKAARALRARYPRASIVVCGELGRSARHAHTAAIAVDGRVAFPTFADADSREGADFNDLCEAEGLDAVNRALANVRTPDACDPPSDARNAPEADCGLEEWPEPTPLPAELPAVEPFALDLMPDALRPWIGDIADRVQCPPDFPAVASMVVLGSVLGRRVPVYPKRRDDWHEYPNLWGAIIGSPGVLKSPAISEVLRPLRELEHLSAEANAADVEDWRRKSAEAAIIRDARKKAARTAAGKGKDFDVSGFMDDDEDEPPAMRRYSVNDSSLEALGEILRGNPNGTLVYQDELIGLLKQLDRQGNEPARAFWLAGWSGKEPYTFDRIGRGLNRRIDAVCLSLFGSIQPGVIGDYLRQAVVTGGGDGLVARMSMLTWPEVGGQWRNVDRFPDSDARNAARSMFQRFDMVTGATAGATPDAIGAMGLRFAPDAQADFDDWREDFERAQRTSDVHPALAAHRNKYRKLVPALALICHLADQPQGGAIRRPALLRALAWTEYLDSHAGRAYASVMRTDAEGARDLLKRIRRREVDSPFRARDVYRNGWSRLSDPEQVHRAVRLLCDFDYLRERSDPTGGRPTSVYTVNPRALT
jgi:putative DNA primase/helicase